MKIGAHLLLGKGLNHVFETAEKLGCNCFQVFLHNPRGWNRSFRQRSEIFSFRKAAEKSMISPVVIHMPYLLNLATSGKEIRLKSMRLLEHEMTESEMMGADYYVIHPGSHRGNGIKSGVNLVADGLKPFCKGKTRILLENTAGQGDSIGRNWEEIGSIIDRLGGSAGICFDTAHAYESGYDISNRISLHAMKDEIEKRFGMGYIQLVHANDSITLKGSNVDRHQHIGEGCIGIKGFENLVKDERFGELPFIIETPKDNEGDDRHNMEILRKLGEKHGKIRF